jgi:diaminopimelate epimerase
MRIKFSKYQGTGNDFIMLDNMDNSFNSLSIEHVKFLCDRKLGIGADGVIKLSHSVEHDFELEYYNSDGSQSFCGNGGRCSVAFANKLRICETNTKFVAIDGVHEGTIVNGIISVGMLPVERIEVSNGDYILDTGSPHYIKLVEAQDELNLLKFGRKIRYSERFKEKGINVNLMSVVQADEIQISTYERGVEDETLSCGTGVTACALVYKFMMRERAGNKITIHTKGGVLYLSSNSFVKEKGFENIWLSGPVKHVFDGIIDV